MPLDDFLKPFNFSFEKEDAVKTGRFLLFFILVYLLGLLFLGALFPIPAQELFIAGNVSAALGAFGIESSVSMQETALVSIQSGPAIAISELCTGSTELLIIVSAIIASIGISWRKRLAGAIAAAAATTAFNYFRVIATILIILGTGDIGAIELAHNVLFRAFLFFTIAVSYIAWFYWAVSAEIKAQSKARAAK
ncbi:MAG: hypothetical protein JW744_00610 [Candidatus Diapherotrites archaeon]|uniref:Exosortase/archaeosortase family protein n=1 Tax=Candidatus Iainarchaeum sp. TaxID=3101447 RepID=A0A938YVP1_9ARCH|nr:hypothetical protein [Candidatus Diapherotrites archaeon]